MAVTAVLGLYAGRSFAEASNVEVRQSTGADTMGTARPATEGVLVANS